ncbi:hypothetical protein [Streptomyces sp. NPDC058739]|uniref:hypothetical protein n=1 Tax=Streptomyces sp. NPDC058739 TaxID=3346618 RepID=UPI0036A9CE16
MVSQSTWRRRYVAPVAQAAGLVPDGKVFRLTGERGDCALIEFHPHRIDPKMEVFFARVSVVPFPQRAWAYRQHWDQAKDLPATSGEAMLHWDLIPPETVAWDPAADMPARGYWAYGPRTDPGACAEEFVRMLREDTFPQMRRLLDREELTAEMKRRSPGFHHRRPPGWAEVLLNVDRLEPAALEPLLARVETDFPVADEFITWARDYAAARR